MTISTSSLIQKMLLFILVIAGLYYLKVFIMPLAIAGVIATLFLPFCKWLEGKQVPKGLAVLLCLIVLLMVIAGIGSLLVWQINALLQDFEIVKQKTLNIITFLQQYIFDHLGISTEKQSKIFEGEQPSITNIVQMIAGSIVYIITNFVLIIAYIFCLLYYRSHIKKFILRLTPPSAQVEMEQVVYNATHVSQQYLLGLAKMIVCLWIMYGIGFSLLGVKNALLFAILCGLFEIVPYIGNMTGTALTVFVSAVHGTHLPILFGIIGVYGIIQFVQGWLLEPIIVGPQVKINPFSTILALVSGELIWGIPGIFLAIPLLAMFKIVCDHIEPLKPFGYLIGEVVKEKKRPV